MTGSGMFENVGAAGVGDKTTDAGTTADACTSADAGTTADVGTADDYWASWTC